MKACTIITIFLMSFVLSSKAFSQAQDTLVVPIAKTTIACNTHLPKEFSKDPHRLATRGIACFEDKQYTQALKFYRIAYSVEPSPIFTAAIGRALQELKLPSLAKPHFIQYLNKAKLNEEGANKINQQLIKIDDLLKNAAELHIYSSEPEAIAYLVIGGTYFEELGKTPLSIPLLEGKYEIAIKKPGFTGQRIHVDLLAKQTHERFVELHSVNEAFHLTQSEWKKRGAYFMIGSAPLIIAGGTLFTIGAIKTSDSKIPSGELRNNLVRSGTDFKQYGMIAGAAGVLFFATGVVLYLNGMTEIPDSSVVVSPNSVSYRYVF